MPYSSNRIKNIPIGTKFGDLIIIGEPTKHTTGKTTRAMFLCKCKCGRETWITGSQLRKGKRLRCTYCAYRERPQSTERLSNLERYYSLSVVRRCKKGKIKNNISLDDYEKIIKQNCYYCGEPPKKISYLNKNRIALKSDFYGNGVDRINSLGNYDVDNCVPCCTQCNIMKMSYTKDEFFSKIKIIYEKWIKQEDTIKEK